MILRVFKKNIFCVILVGDLSGLLAAELALGVELLVIGLNCQKKKIYNFYI